MVWNAFPTIFDVPNPPPRDAIQRKPPRARDAESVQRHQEEVVKEKSKDDANLTPDEMRLKVSKELLAEAKMTNQTLKKKLDALRQDYETELLLRKGRLDLKASGAAGISADTVIKALEAFLPEKEHKQVAKKIKEYEEWKREVDVRLNIGAIDEANAMEQQVAAPSPAKKPRRYQRKKKSQPVATPQPAPAQSVILLSVQPGKQGAAAPGQAKILETGQPLILKPVNQPNSIGQQQPLLLQ